MVHRKAVHNGQRVELVEEMTLVRRAELREVAGRDGGRRGDDRAGLLLGWTSRWQWSGATTNLLNTSMEEAIVKQPTVAHVVVGVVRCVSQQITE
jgi:hypothetical protein